MADKKEYPEHIRQAVDLIAAVLRRIKEKALDEIRHAILSAIPKGVTGEDVAKLLEKIFTEVK